MGARGPAAAAADSSVNKAAAAWATAAEILSNQDSTCSADRLPSLGPKGAEAAVAGADGSRRRRRRCRRQRRRELEGDGSARPVATEGMVATAAKGRRQRRTAPPASRGDERLKIIWGFLTVAAAGCYLGFHWAFWSFLK